MRSNSPARNAFDASRTSSSLMRVSFAEYVVDLGTRQALRGAQEIFLSPKAFQLLELMIARRPDAVSKEELHRVLWPETFVAETNLANLVNELRVAFGDT